MVKCSIFFSVLFLCTGCGLSVSHHPSPAEDHADNSIKSIELYVSRASLTRTEFEQYKISSHRIFNECGKVYGGRYTSELQNLVKLADSDEEEINKLAGQIITFNKEYDLDLDKPGASTSMFDPGQFTLKIQRQSETTLIKTSLDSVASASKTSEENLNKLAKKLREIALNNSNQSLCGNRHFYDL